MKRAAGVLAVAVAVVAAPASANAATLGLTPAKGCYREGEEVSLSGGGYTPNATASVVFDTTPLGNLLADPAGNIGSPLTIGDLSGAETRTMTATDSANPANVGTVQFLASAVTVRVRPRRGAPGRRLRIRATGFTTGKRLYAHAFRRGFRRNIRVGRLKGPCRRGKARKRIFPSSAPTGRYTVQFDTKRRYSRRTQVRVRFRVTISRRVRAASAAAAADGWTRID